VEVHALALSDSAGKADLHVPRENGRSMAAVGRLAPIAGVESETIAVDTARLDDVLSDDAARVAFVKCDVEGHELAVLRGAAKTLAEARPALLVEIERRHAGERMDETFAYLAELGYEGFAIGPDGPMPLGDFDVERDQLAFLGDSFETGTMPSAYVHDFFFAPRRVDAQPGERGMDALARGPVRVALANQGQRAADQAGS
jgi:hypothetical protein